MQRTAGSAFAFAVAIVVLVSLIVADNRLAADDSNSFEKLD